MAESTTMNLTQEVNNLEQQVSRMGGLCEDQLMTVIKALETRDAGLARDVISGDGIIDTLREQIEEQALSIISRRAPVPLVLRSIAGAMRIAGDLERIGDLTKNIGKRITAIEADLGHTALIKPIVRMGDLSIAQLKSILNGYGQHNDELALDVWRRDEDIDRMYNSIFRELLTYMMEDSRTISFCTHLLFCAKNIERVGDHCTNIAETVHYILKASKLVDERPKLDSTSFSAITPPSHS